MDYELTIATEVTPYRGHTQAQPIRFYDLRKILPHGRLICFVPDAVRGKALHSTQMARTHSPGQ